MSLVGMILLINAMHRTYDRIKWRVESTFHSFETFAPVGSLSLIWYFVLTVGKYTHALALVLWHPSSPHSPATNSPQGSPLHATSSPQLYKSIKNESVPLLSAPTYSQATCEGVICKAPTITTIPPHQLTFDCSISQFIYDASPQVQHL